MLTAHNIECKIEKSRVVVDKIIIGDGVNPEVHLKIRPEDFDRANQIIDEEIEKRIGETDPDYYLYSFTNEELQDIVNKPDEWNNQDVVIARKILNDRGRYYSLNEIEKIKSDRLRDLKEPIEQKSSSLLVGYVLAIFFCLIGIFYSLYMLNATKILPNGEKVPIYNKNSRGHYRTMLAISIFLFIIVLWGQLKNNRI